MNIEKLEIRLREAKEHYLAIRSSAESAIVSTEWSTGQLYDTEPFEVFRAGEEYGKRISSTPKRTNKKYCYGFDRQGQIVVRRQGVEFVGQFYEEFFEYHKNRIDSVYYGSTALKEVLSVKSRVVDNGLVRTVFVVGRFGSRIEHMKYVDGQLVAIDVDQIGGVRFQTVISYGNQKTVIAIQNVFPNGRLDQLYPPE